MTCIVAVTDGRRVTLAGDSAAIDGDGSDPFSNHKVFVRGSVAMGFNGAFCVGDLLQYELSFSPPTENPKRWIRTSFLPSIRDAAKANDVDLDESDIMVGVLGHLFIVQCSDYSVLEPPPLAKRGRLRAYAIGMGGPWAMGALYALRSSDLTQQQIATEALEASARYCSGVRAPFRFVEVG